MLTPQPQPRQESGPLPNGQSEQLQQLLRPGSEPGGSAGDFTQAVLGGLALRTEKALRKADAGWMRG